MMIRRIVCLAALLAAALAPESTLAAETLDGTRLDWPWAIPFMGILLVIATGPVMFHALWHRHYPLFALTGIVITLAAITFAFGASAAAAAFVHTALAEYLSFIVLLFALYVVAGGILLTGDIKGTPATNATILAAGTLIASVVGTTGAAMILIRPLLRANAHRQNSAHVVVFFIFLVCNIGGALTPLGDPPLFIGFLRGVDFFWTTQQLWWQTLLVSAIVLAIFVALDIAVARRNGETASGLKIGRLRLKGSVNFLLIALIIAAILISAVWRPGIAYDVYGTDVALQNLLRDAVLVLIAAASLWLTPHAVRSANKFSWEPIREVAILFAAIFTCIIPVLAMLDAGRNGPFAGLLDIITTPDGAPRNTAYFWLTGILSAFLDNAPTYLVFFGLAGGDSSVLMTTLAPTLAAISMGAVYMGALTYVGNAPNFMVYAVASEAGVRMPSFFSYMLWSCAVLGPVLVLLSLISF